MDIGVLASDTLELLRQRESDLCHPFSIGGGPRPASILPVNLPVRPAKWALPDIVVPDTSGGVTFCQTFTIP